MADSTSNEPGGYVVPVETPSGLAVGIPAELLTPHVFRIMQSLDERIPADTDEPERVGLFVSQLLRRLAGAEKARTNAQTAYEVELSMVATHHAAKIKAAAELCDSLEACIAHLAPKLKYPGKAKSLKFPYGTVGKRWQSAKFEVQPKEENPNADLAFTAWALANMPGDCDVFENVDGDVDRLTAAAEAIAAAVGAEGLQVTETGTGSGTARKKIAERWRIAPPSMSEVFKAMEAKPEAQRKVPDGLRLVEGYDKGFANADGPASREVEALDVVPADD